MLFGDSISLFEGLQITLLGMLVVFLALMFLLVILVVMEKVFYKNPQAKAAGQQSRAVETQIPAQTTIEEGDQTELIAVIAAAVASSLGVQPTNLVVRNIVRMPETAPVWGLAGRTDQMNRML